MSTTSTMLTQEDIDLGLQGVQEMIDVMVSDKYAEGNEKTLKDVLSRISDIIAKAGKQYGYDKKDIAIGQEALLNGFFIPGGSILSGLKRNTAQKSSMSNCYVMKIPNDSIEGIFQGMCEMARTYSYRGGCGVDITVLRPNGTAVSNTAKFSTGAVSFMPMISSVTETIGQAGRRGAALISLDVMHPDIMRFIWCKADPERVLYKDRMNKTYLAKQLKPFTDILLGMIDSMPEEAKVATRAICDYVNADGAMGSINGANISIRVSREFMQAVKENKPWACYFPDIDADKELYNREWNGDYDHWKAVGGTLKKYTTYTACITKDNAEYFVGSVLCRQNENVPNVILTKESIQRLLSESNGTFYGTFELPSARDILKNIAQASWLRGDPGILFWDHMCEWSTVYDVHEDLKFRTTNPCGELALAWLSACNLGAHIFSQYVLHGWTDQASFNWDAFRKYCKAAVILQNIFLDINKDRHPLEAQRKADAFARRIGIEFTAFADMLSMLNLDYGDDPVTLSFVEKMMHVKAITEIQASLDLAKLQGPCDAFKEDLNPGGRKRFLEQPYVQFILSLDPHLGKDIRMETFYREQGITKSSLKKLQQEIAEYGLRNTGFNCVGPTGSISVLANNSSSGIEPVFALSYKRRTRIGDKLEYTMCHAPLLKHLKTTQQRGPFDIVSLKEKYHITEAHDLNHLQRIAMQATVQRYHDGSISSTVNLPSTCTPEEIADIYLYAWEQKLKGITVYRAGSLEGVIIANTNDNDKKTPSAIEEALETGGYLAYDYLEKDCVTSSQTVGMLQTMLAFADVMETSKDWSPTLWDTHVKINDFFSPVVSAATPPHGYIDNPEYLCLNEKGRQVYWDVRYSASKALGSIRYTNIFPTETGEISMPKEKASATVALKRGELIQLPKQRASITHEVMWNGTKMYAVVSMDNEGNPMEIFINLPREVSIDKNGIFNENDYQNKMSMWMALTRMISMTLRLGGSVSLCVKQMRKASFAVNDPMSIITRVLSHYDGSAGAKEATEGLNADELETSIYTSICPSCGRKAYVRESGCFICRLCNHTKCE